MENKNKKNNLENTNAVDYGNLIAQSAKALEITSEQFKVGLLVLAKLKNYFSDIQKSYRLASNHKEAFKAILLYIKDNNIKDIAELKDLIYSIKKFYNAKSLKDAEILNIKNIEVISRKFETKKDDIIVF